MIQFIKFVTLDDNGDEVCIPYGYPVRGNKIGQSPNEISPQTAKEFIANHHPEYLKQPRLIGVDINGKWFTAEEIKKNTT
ncbi:hypothetical protein [Effusibacillus pohliae]|uniref:hypothetical protein n=1 Tax=Effusibacillus pohliae TaxID=232270 RepID=UPI00037F9283|nr:hypothetical protein [Effusibacillus pohliae]